MKPKSFLAAILVLTAVCLAATPLALGQEQTYTVKSGDTLWGLAQRFYQDPFLWPKLWEMNRSRVTNPHELSVGQVLVIYAKEKVARAKVPAPSVPQQLYDWGQPLETVFPKFFNYMANPAGLADTGINRVQVKKLHPRTGKLIQNTYEVHPVGEIIASEERGYTPAEAGIIHGRVLLSYFDNVYVHFTKDVAEVLDSKAYGDRDPYFREYGVYSLGDEAKEPSDPKQKKVLGQLYRYKGVVTVVARVETSRVPLTKKQEERLAKTPGYIDREPTFYVGRITNSALPLEIGDQLFLFKLVERIE